jgi:hypothetical protein
MAQQWSQQPFECWFSWWGCLNHQWRAWKKKGGGTPWFFRPRCLRSLRRPSYIPGVVVVIFCGFIIRFLGLLRSRFGGGFVSVQWPAFANLWVGWWVCGRFLNCGRFLARFGWHCVGTGAWKYWWGGTQWWGHGGGKQDTDVATRSRSIPNLGGSGPADHQMGI